MSIIGINIFSDEFAMSVRDEYKALLGLGFIDEDAEKYIIQAFIDAILGAEQEDIFWLALAMTEWKVGRLSESVK